MNTLPSSDSAERFVLGSVLLDHTFFDQGVGTLEPDDFTLEKHRRIFRRMSQIHARGERIDRVTVANELGRFHELESCDGLSYLISLDDGLPHIPSIEDYVRILKEKTVARKLIATAQQITNRCQSGEDPPDKILAWAEDALLKLGQSRGRVACLTASDLAPSVLEMADQREQQWRETGKTVTGIESGIGRLDELLNGFSPGLYLLGGGPGVGKTSICLQFATEVCQRGTPAVYVTYENSPRNLVLKAICNRAGVSPRDIERGSAHSDDLQKFRAAGRALGPALSRLTFIEGSMSLQLAEVRAKVIEVLREEEARTCLLIFDYLQRAAPAQGEKEMRTNVSALAGHLRDLANRLDCPVLALSSQNRAQGNYGSGRGGANLDSLKESGDLEYSADCVMFLHPSEQRQTNDDRVKALDLTISKNRFGPMGSVALIFRGHIGDFREEEQSKAAPPSAKNTKR